MEVCCEILFFHVILLFMGVVIEYPITFHIYNIGAILISENTLVSQQTNHIDVRHHFISDYIEDSTVKLNLSVHNKTWQIHLQRT